MMKMKLEGARVPMKMRNELLRDFKFGFKSQDVSGSNHSSQGSVGQPPKTEHDIAGNDAVSQSNISQPPENIHDTVGNNHSSRGSTAQTPHEFHDIATPDSSVNSNTSPSCLVITLPTFKGFDPAKAGLNRIIILPGFRYCFHADSSIHERIVYERVIRQNVEAVMAGRPPNDTWTRQYGGYVAVANGNGKLVAEGYFNNFNGAASPDSGWLFAGKEEF